MEPGQELTATLTSLKPVIQNHHLDNTIAQKRQLFITILDLAIANHLDAITVSLECFPEEVRVFEDVAEFAFKSVAVGIREGFEGLKFPDVGAESEDFGRGFGGGFGADGEGREGFDGRGERQDGGGGDFGGEGGD